MTDYTVSTMGYLSAMYKAVIRPPRNNNSHGAQLSSQLLQQVKVQGWCEGRFTSIVERKCRDGKAMQRSSHKNNIKHMGRSIRTTDLPSACNATLLFCVVLLFLLLYTWYGGRPLHSSVRNIPDTVLEVSTRSDESRDESTFSDFYRVIRRTRRPPPPENWPVSISIKLQEPPPYLLPNLRYPCDTTYSLVSLVFSTFSSSFFFLFLVALTAARWTSSLPE